MGLGTFLKNLFTGKDDKKKDDKKKDTGGSPSRTTSNSSSGSKSTYKPTNPYINTQNKKPTTPTVVNPYIGTQSKNADTVNAGFAKTPNKSTTSPPKLPTFNAPKTTTASSTPKLPVYNTPTNKPTLSIFTPTVPHKNKQLLKPGAKPAAKSFLDLTAADVFLNTARYQNYKATKEAQKNKKANIYSESDVRDTYDLYNYNAVTKYAVNDLTASTYGTLAEGLLPTEVSGVEVPPSTEIWYIKDGNAFMRTDTTTGIKEIGRERLSGITENDKYVLYDKNTGTLHKFAVPDAKYSTAEVEANIWSLKMDNISIKSNSELAAYDKQLADIERKYNQYATRVKNGKQLTNKDYAEMQQLEVAYTKLNTERAEVMNNYTAQYGEALEKYNGAKSIMSSYGMSMEEWQTYQELDKKAKQIPLVLSDAEAQVYAELDARVKAGNTYIYPNADWTAKRNTELQYVEEVRAAKEKQSKIYSDFMSDTQVNSLSDVLRRITSRAIFRQDPGTTFGQDVAELWNRTLVMPFSVASEEIDRVVTENKTTWTTDAEDSLKDSNLPDGIKKFLYAWRSSNVAHLGAFKDAVTTAGMVALNNTLVSFAETMDLIDLNVFIKPYVVGQAAFTDRRHITNEALMDNNAIAMSKYGSGTPGKPGMYQAGWTSTADLAGWEAVKAYWGAYGTTPSYEYDFLFSEEDQGKLGTIAISVFYEILFNPATLLTGTIKPDVPLLSDVTKTDIVDTFRKVYEDAGVRLPNTLEVRSFLETEVDKMYRGLLRNTTATDLFVNNTQQLVDSAFISTAKNMLPDLLATNSVRNTLEEISEKSTKELYLEAVQNVTAKVGLNAVEATKAFPTKLSTAYTSVASLRKVKAAKEFVNKSVIRLAAPGTAVPGLIGHFAKPLVNAATNTKLVQNAATAVGRITHKVADVFDKPGALARDIRAVVKEVDKELAQLYTIADDASLEYLNRFSRGTFASLVDGLVGKELDPVRVILTSNKPAAEIMEMLDKHVIDNVPGYNSFTEYWSKVLDNVNVVDRLGTYSVVTRIDEVKRAYNRLVINNKISIIDNHLAEVTGYAKDIRTQLSKFVNDGVLDLMTVESRHSLTLMHNALTAVDDAFAQTFTHVSGTEFHATAEALWEELIYIGDNLTYEITTDREVVDAFVQKVESFLTQVDNYTKDINAHVDQLRYRAYTPVQFDEVPADAFVSKHVQTTIDNLVDAVIRGVRKEHGVNLNPAEVRANVFKENIEEIVKADGSVDLESVTRVYSIMLDKISNTMNHVNCTPLEEAGKAVLDVNTQTHAVLRDLADTASMPEIPKEVSAKAYDTVNTLMTAMASQQYTRAFVNRLTANLKDVPSTYLAAFLDSFAGSGNYTNAIFKSIRDKGDITAKVDRITDDLVERAMQFINGTSDVQYYKLFNKHCNTVDTAANIVNMHDIARSTTFKDVDGKWKTIATKLAEDEDKYLDVYFSMANTVKRAHPTMISFSVDGAVKTFRNTDSPFTMLHTDAFDIYGMSYADALKQYEEVSKRVVGTDTATYVTQIDDYLADVYAQASATGKQVRFIGFNNSSIGVGQDRALNDFARNNALGIHIQQQVDIANYVRGIDGIENIPKNAITGLRNALVDTVYESIPTNGINNITAGLVLDPTINYAKIADDIDSFKGLLPGTETIIDDLTHTLRSAGSAIDRTGASMVHGVAGTLVNEHALCEMITRASNCSRKVTRVNCMKYIRDAAKDAGYNLNLKTKLNIEYMKNWFNPDDVAAFAGSKDLTRYFDDVSNVVHDLDNLYEQVAAPELLNAIGTESYKTLYQVYLHGVFRHSLPYDLPLLRIVSQLDLKDAQDYYSAIMYLQRRFPSALPSYDYLASKVADLAEHGDTKILDALESIQPQTAANIVYNTTHTIKYNTRTKLLVNKYTDVLTQANYRHAMEESFHKTSRTLEDFDSYLAGRDTLAKMNDINTAQELIHYTLFDRVYTPYRNLCEAINAQVPERIKGSAVTLDNAITQYERNAVIAGMQNEVTELQNYHKALATQTVLTLSDEDFVTHVIRNCNNALLIDPNARVFQNKHTSALLYSKLKGLSEKGLLVVEEVDANSGRLLKEVLEEMSVSTGKTVEQLYDERVIKDTYIRVYKDLTGLDARGADELFKQYSEINLGLSAKYVDDVALREHAAVHNASKFSEQYRDFVKDMSEYMPDSYMVSTFEVVTQETVQAIQKYFPESSRLDLRRFNSWFDTSFNCSLIGDRTLQERFNMYASDNIINNMGMGLHHVRNNLEATTNYLAMYTTPTNSLKYMVEHSGAVDWTPAKLKKAIESRGYVLTTATIKNNQWTVHKLPLDNATQLKRYMANEQVICVPNEVFLELQEYSKGVNKKWKLEHANAFQKSIMDMISGWERTARSARTTGYLFVPFAGASVRNMFDANWKAFNDIGAQYSYYAANAAEWQRSYEVIVDSILETDSIVTTETILKYFKNNANPVLNYNTFMKLYSYNSSSAAGLCDMFSIMLDKQTSKLRGLLKEGSTVTDDMLEVAQSEFKRVYAKHVNDVDKPLAVMREEVFARLSKKAGKLGYSSEQVSELADLLYNYTPPSVNWAEGLKQIPVLGRYLEHNAARFTEAETVARTGMAMYYMNECGYTANRANLNVIKTQFNYNARPKVLDTAERLLPFSTYKVYNAAYWLTEAPKSARVMRNALRITRLFDTGYSSEERAVMLRNQMMRDKLANGELTVNEEGELRAETGTAAALLANTMYHTIGDVIEEYKGVPSMFASGLRLGDNHYLKLGNSFVDALDFMTSSYLAPLELANGLIPTILGDNVYSPIATFLSAINFLVCNGGSADGKLLFDEEGNVVDYEGFAEWLNANYYDVIDFIPFWGALGNQIIAHIKNGKVNMSDMIAMNCDPNLKDEYVYRMYESLLDIAGTAVPALVGTLYDSAEFLHKPIGYDWYNQDEEYRKTHRYVLGVSDVRKFVKRDPVTGAITIVDPSTYIDYVGMYEKMGYSKEEALEILNWLYGSENTQLTTEMYQNQSNDSKVYWDINMVNYTLEYLVSKRGYSAEEAMRLIMSDKFWVNPATGKFSTDADVMAQFMNSAFLDKYNQLPDYIKYDKHQYNMLKEYYSLKGYNTEQIWIMMQTHNGYIDEEGLYRELTDEQVVAYNTQINTDFLEFLNELPDWYQYEPGAATRSINELIKKGMTLDEAHEYIIKNNYYVDEDGAEHWYSAEEVKAKSVASSKEFTDYYSQLPNYLKYEKGAYSRTLSYLKGLGYTTDDAKALIKGGAYYTVDGRLIDCSDLERKRAQYNSTYSTSGKKGMSGKAFKEYYNSLPDYLKYEKGAYSRTYQYLKGLGYDYSTIQTMIKNGAYLTKEGKLIDCRGLKRPARGSYYSNKSYNNYKKYTKVYAPRPKYVKKTYIQRPKSVRKPYTTKGSYSKTYSKVNAFAGASYGMRKVYKVSLGYNPVRQSLSIKSTYPASYRNIVYAHRRNLYKENYAKYGMSRMFMRSGLYKGYSNASITKLRRNNLYSRMRYGNRRSNF